MPKQVEKTAGLIKEIQRSVGDPNLDTSNFAVFETRLVSTAPIDKKGFHDGARLSRNTLVEMAEFVNADSSTLPLQIMHDKDVLPVGRVFSATVSELPTGESELEGLFYIAKTDEFKTSLIADIESSTIDEVSVGILTEHAFCSECNFDYFGEESDFSNIWSLTCNDGHTIGEKGCHVRLVGMDTFSELSLVNRGASTGAKIRSSDKHKIEFSHETIKRLAASGMPTELHYCQLDTKLSKTKTPIGDLNMPGIEVAEFAAINKSLGKVEVELSLANEQIVTLEASLEAKAVELKESKDLQAKGAVELKAENEKLEAELSGISGLVFDDLKAALVASGETEADVPETLPAMLSMIKDKGLKLHQLFGAEPESENHKDDVKTELAQEERRKANFKINK